MAITLPSIFLIGLAIYTLAGLLFALAFVWKGVGQVDPVARNSGFIFRLLILPGCVLLWPFLLGKWRSNSRSANS
jgi:hypothetical protein